MKLLRPRNPLSLTCSPLPLALALFMRRADLWAEDPPHLGARDDGARPNDAISRPVSVIVRP